MKAEDAITEPIYEVRSLRFAPRESFERALDYGTMGWALLLKRHAS